MPRIVDRLPPPEDPPVLADDGSVLPDHDPLGIGMDLDRPANRRRQDRVSVVVEPDRAGLRDRGGDAVEAVEGAGVANQMRTLGLEHLPDGPAALLGMAMRLGMGHASVGQPGVLNRAGLPGGSNS